MNVTFEYEKETKRTIRFTEVDNDANLEKAIGTLYVQKAALEALGLTSDEYEGAELNVLVEIA